MEFQGLLKSIRDIGLNTGEAIFVMPKDFSFRAGEYVSITLPQLKNLETREQFRDFSIASSPNVLPNLAIIFRKSESAFKRTLLSMKLGESILVDGPKGIFTLPDSAQRPLVFVAGGVGLAPFFSMLNFIAEKKLEYRVSLINCNRTEESAVYLRELESLAQANPALKIINVFGLLEEKHLVPLNVGNPIWYVAGPPGMVKEARDTFLRLGIIEEDIKTEEFSGY